MSLDVVCLGFLQGLTEFLPVSSSGHLGLFKALFGMDGPTLAFDLVLHMATLFAVLIYFARDIFRLVAEWACGFFNRNAHDREGWRFGWAVSEPGRHTLSLAEEPSQPDGEAKKAARGAESEEA